MQRKGALGPLFFIAVLGFLAERAGAPLRRRFALATNTFAGPSAFKLCVAHQAATSLRRVRNLIVDLVCVGVCRLNFLRCRAQRGVLRLAVYWAWPVQNLVL